MNTGYAQRVRIKKKKKAEQKRGGKKKKKKKKEWIFLFSQLLSMSGFFLLCHFTDRKELLSREVSMKMAFRISSSRFTP